MRRKRRIWYEVTTEHNWWCGRGVGWKENLDGINYVTASSHRYFQTAKRAFAHANATPKSTLVKWFYKKGRRYIQEFTKV